MICQFVGGDVVLYSDVELKLLKYLQRFQTIVYVLIYLFSQCYNEK